MVLVLVLGYGFEVYFHITFWVGGGPFWVGCACAWCGVAGVTTDQGPLYIFEIYNHGSWAKYIKLMKKYISPYSDKVK